MILEFLTLTLLAHPLTPDSNHYLTITNSSHSMTACNVVIEVTHSQPPSVETITATSHIDAQGNHSITVPKNGSLSQTAKIISSDTCH